MVNKAGWFSARYTAYESGTSPSARDPSLSAKEHKWEPYGFPFLVSDYQHLISLTR